jgi:hypothetical protein
MLWLGLLGLIVGIMSGRLVCPHFQTVLKRNYLSIFIGIMVLLQLTAHINIHLLMTVQEGNKTLYDQQSRTFHIRVLITGTKTILTDLC